MNTNLQNITLMNFCTRLLVELSGKLTNLLHIFCLVCQSKKASDVSKQQCLSQVNELLFRLQLQMVLAIISQL